MAVSFAVQGFKIFAEPVEATLPFDAPVGDPALSFSERRRIDAAGAHPSRLFRKNEPGGLEHREVLHHRRQRHDERPLEIADRRWAMRQPLDHRPAGRIGERLERTVERRRIVKHTLWYYGAN